MHTTPGKIKRDFTRYNVVYPLIESNYIKAHYLSKFQIAYSVKKRTNNKKLSNTTSISTLYVQKCKNLYTIAYYTLM